MNFNHEELMLMMLYNTGTRMGLVHELRLMQCYLMPDETALRELSEGVIEKLKLLTECVMQNVIDRKKIKVIKANGEVSMDASLFAK